MKRHRAVLAVLLILAVMFVVPVEMLAGSAAAAESGSKKLIYDEAGLLSPEAYEELNELANQYGAQRETDIIIVTSNNPNNEDVMRMAEDFYDEHAPGYDKPHGNAVILTLDMRNRQIYLAGFYKAEQYLDDSRLDKIRNKISGKLTDGDYEGAFRKYMVTAYNYLDIRPGVNPDNILYKTWFQLLVSLGIGGLVVGSMVRNAGGRVTVSGQTYMDSSSPGVLQRGDQYLHTTTTSRKIERNNSSGSSDGGTTSGGHSHSGSRGSF
ncbi:TPM domain-containing protein [Paenibacillus medicaginis]|uniref:TPM domain-containing protein n=1 Tax=Paenibacillus medicaginis TaxID=1470560 RepID=A0ABV5C390_9BACL